MPIDLVSQLVSAAIRVFALGLVTFVALLLFRIRSSAVRHATWTVVLVGMLLQIPLEVVAPTVSLKVLPTLPTPVQPRVMESARISVPLAQTLAPASRTRTEPKGGWLASSGTCTGVYLAISMLLFVRMALGSWGLRRILRNAKPIPNLGPGIFESVSFVVPGSVGCFRARILLPRGWRDWDAVKLRAVLAHERAHIRRRDWLIRIASHVNVCIFWFHPLAWWMERELARLAEEACDDLALSEIEDREEYAATLVDIAHAAAADGGVLNWRVISMATESNVIRRVNRILTRGLQAPKPIGRLAWVILLACSLPVIYLSAVVRLASANRDSIVLEHAAVPTRPAEGARQTLLPEQKPLMRVTAQATPNQPIRPAPPLSPSRREDPRITMCILIDNSGSMRDKRARVKAAALALVRASKPHDEVCIVDFNDEAFNDLPNGKDFTSDAKEMKEALTRIDSRGGSAVRDAVWMSIDHVEQKAHNDRRVLVLVTDGDDTSSTVTQEQLLGKVKKSGVLIYCIGSPNEADLGQAGAARRALGQLAEVSGGVNYYPKDLADVESISGGILDEVRKR
jgi:beta-lactamase regulating signal transducer with metallopeptidase domain/Mg-chelatase subunit ChlD